MSYKFSIECTGMTKIISPSLIANSVQEKITKDINVVMESGKTAALKMSMKFLNDDFVKAHGSEIALKNVINEYGAAFNNVIKYFNAKGGSKSSTYAFLENIFFLDLDAILRDNTDFSTYKPPTAMADFDAGALAGIDDYLDEKGIEPTTETLFMDLYPDEEYDDYTDEYDDDEDYDPDDPYYDTEGTTPEDFDKVTKYTIAIYDSATNSEVKFISDAIDTIFSPVYREVLGAKGVDSSLLVVPIIAFTLKKAPSFVIKKNKKNDIVYIVRDDDGGLIELD